MGFKKWFKESLGGDKPVTQYEYNKNFCLALIVVFALFCNLIRIDNANEYLREHRHRENIEQRERHHRENIERHHQEEIKKIIKECKKKRDKK